VVRIVAVPHERLLAHGVVNVAGVCVRSRPLDRALVNELGARERSIVLATYGAGLTKSEIGTRLACRKATSRSCCRAGSPSSIAGSRDPY
jgi:hypothetical protein